jgi:flavin-dependent dehydrogenase
MQDTVKYDIVILGTGPAGLQAAIHAARRKVSVLLLGKQNLGRGCFKGFTDWRSFRDQDRKWANDSVQKSYYRHGRSAFISSLKNWMWLMSSGKKFKTAQPFFMKVRK